MGSGIASDGSVALMRIASITSVRESVQLPASSEPSVQRVASAEPRSAESSTVVARNSKMARMACVSRLPWPSRLVGLSNVRTSWSCSVHDPELSRSLTYAVSSSGAE